LLAVVGAVVQMQVLDLAMEVVYWVKTETDQLQV
jgi:hypothetical protein